MTRVEATFMSPRLPQLLLFGGVPLQGRIASRSGHFITDDLMETTFAKWVSTHTV